MSKQLVYDLSYVLMTKKYRYLSLLIVVLSVGLVIYLGSTTGLKNDALIEVFSQFRQLYWIIIVYFITDFIATDYSAQTFKNVIPYLKNRTIYLTSKLIIIYLTSLGFLFLHFSSVWLFLKTSASSISLSFFLIPTLLLGHLIASLVFSSLLLFIMIVSSKEIVTISVAFSVVLLSFLVEAIPELTDYLPTVLLTSLAQLLAFAPISSLVVLGVYLLAALALFLYTNQYFKGKDLFV